MPLVVHGHTDLDALIAGLGLTSEGATIHCTGWRRQQLIFRLAMHWFTGSRRPVGGRIVFASPARADWLSPEFWRRSTLIASPAEFAFTGSEAVRALAGFLAEDQLREDFFPECAPEQPLIIKFGADPMSTRVRDNGRPAGDTVALMQITAPRHVPDQDWNDSMEPRTRAESTPLSYAAMFDAIKHCFALAQN
ncbi:hypothetical protein [Amycolatopsis sp. VC5-11]|uniref:hypothetical protein n=1 Tax=Amycolatopsis sp. VC5-11 TaxID=3120156 RepID=UPI003008E0AB